jgi:hypothetical protein
MKTPFAILRVAFLAVFLVGEIPARAVPPPPSEISLSGLIRDGKIEAVSVGTGRSMGHVADVRLRNLTGARLTVPMPVMVLESASRNYQHYACFRPQTVTIGGGGSKTVPLDGICLTHNKPPVPKGLSGELLFCDGDPRSPRPPESQFTAKECGKLTRVAKSYAAAADKLELEGAYADMPYRQPKKNKEIVTQWGVWSDPKVAQITHTKRATKEDFKKSVVRQAEEKKPLEPEEKQQLEQDTEDIFKDIQLTSKEAKSLEEPDPFAGVELTGPKAKSEG